MLTRHWPLLAAVAFNALFPATALSDTVVIRSGERLGGKITHKSRDLLTLQTDYAGEIHVQWSKVTSIISDAPLILQLEGSRGLIGAKVGEDGPGKLVVTRQVTPGTTESTETIPLSSVVYINPLPEETHNGVNYKGWTNLSFSKAQGNTHNESLYGETAFTARAREYRYELNAKANRSEEPAL